MSLNLNFRPSPFRVLIAGQSAMDLSFVNVQTKEQGRLFFYSYGFDVDKVDDLKKIWEIHKRAVDYIEQQLLYDDEVLPEKLASREQLDDITNLLIYASVTDSKEDSLQKWSCALLKVMHVVVHLDNDIFNSYSSKIQDQILTPIQEHIIDSVGQETVLGHHNASEIIPLRKFAVKSYKTSGSSITKLLAKPNEVAFNVLDKIGVRFVTHNIFDSFRVMRYLLQQNIINAAHVIPDQSNNTIYPLELFFKTIEACQSDMSDHEIESILRKALEENSNQSGFVKKNNIFTDEKYKFIKWIGRRLIHVENGEGTMSFFYPYEIQIIDYDNYLMSLNGPTSHGEYKARQKKKARERVLRN